MLTCTIKKSKKVSIEKKIQSLQNNLPKAMQKIMEHGQQTALDNKVGSKDKRLIPFIIEKDGDRFKGTLYTNFSFAPFLEYGTGAKAELPHIGKTRLFRFSGFECWYAPAEEVKKQYSDRAGIEINLQWFPMNAYMNGKKYVMVFSQSPRPFMRPTAFELEKSAVDILKQELRKK